MLVIAAPGQGAQTPGFLAPWLEIGTIADGLATLSDHVGLDLAHYGTDADAETIRDTAVAQPLLVGAAITVADVLFPALSGAPLDLPEDATHPGLARAHATLVAGHSVGELAALSIAGVVTANDAMGLVVERGRAMADAAAVTATGMTAVLGGDREEVLAALERHGLTPANDNGPGQIVAAGTMEQLAALQDDPPAKARLIPLSVAGAFHTRHMAPAVERLRAEADDTTVHQPQVPLLSNRDGERVASGREALDRVVDQVSNPVRWDLCMEGMLAAGATGLIELVPGGTLTGIARRAMKGVATFALKTPDQLDDAREFCEQHAVRNI